MASIFDYLTWRGDLDFNQSPPNPVDYAIFSQISYLPFDGIVPGPGEKEGISLYLALNALMKKLENNKHAKKPVFMFREDPDFITALASSNRFKNCHLIGYVNHINAERQIQFSAVCVNTGDDSFSVIFRGTDLSFVGWKEDFNMAFSEIIPSQIEAVKYLENMATMVKGTLRISGHSKGGNLAVFSASRCSKNIQMRITDIYSYDAPGFHRKVFDSEGYSSIRDKIHSYIPQTSIVGMVLEQGCDYTVIRSSETGLMQHSLFSWDVTHNDMIHVDDVSVGSRFVDKTLKEWLGSLDNDQREKFIEAIYAILSKSEVKSINELESSWLISVGRIMKSLGDIDASTRRLILNTIAELFRSAGRNIDTLFNRKTSD
ncbi:MAG: DUF2974 domain-containing protein [Treponema sp.]|jgi:hypothetical protein|nr:DUF2974 domain-containing protein [Treponema sp.]